MKRAQVKERVQQFLGELGIPTHCIGIKIVSPATEVTVAIGGLTHRFVARTGVTSNELDQELGRLRGIWNQRVRDGQGDIEDTVNEQAAQT